MAINHELKVLPQNSRETGKQVDQLTRPTHRVDNPVGYVGHAGNFARPIPPSHAANIAQSRKPPWLKIRPPSGESYLKIKALTETLGLNTVCQEARCPNLSECWNSGTATFMLGSDTCTRACRFCAVKTARIPPPLDPKEPEKLAHSIAALNLEYVVLTSVDRDDLIDGGAQHFADSISAIKLRCKGIHVEALVPDFKGNTSSIETIVSSGLDVYSHNLETIRRLHYRVRDPRANYDQSLATLRYAKLYSREREKSLGKKLFTKSSLMLGFGERAEEILEAAKDLHENEVDIITLGQYLRPTLSHLPVEKFWTPEEFSLLAIEIKALGFMFVASGPLVRSSYRASEVFVNDQLKEQVYAI